MDLIVPSYGRAREQTTLAQLSRAGLHTYLVVQAREYLEYAKYASPLVTVVQLPDNIRTIAPTRQHIVDHVGSSVEMVMLDDDLTFYKRRDDDKTKLRDITPDELTDAFGGMWSLLRKYAHVGFAAREGANRETGEFIRNTRIMRVLGYNRAALKSASVRFDAMEVMEDFHVALSLLRAGKPNIVMNNYAHNQAGSGKAGGCSHFRTMELHAENAHKLAALHPKFVKVVQKATKGAWGGGTRTDVTIQWKKAYGTRT